MNLLFFILVDHLSNPKNTRNSVIVIDKCMMKERDEHVCGVLPVK